MHAPRRPYRWMDKTIPQQKRRSKESNGKLQKYRRLLEGVYIDIFGRRKIKKREIETKDEAD